MAASVNLCTQPSWSKVVCGGMNYSGARTSQPLLELSNLYTVQPDKVPTHSPDAAVVLLLPHLDAAPSGAAVSPPPPVDVAKKICIPSTGKLSKQN